MQMLCFQIHNAIFRLFLNLKLALKLHYIKQGKFYFNYMETLNFRTNKFFLKTKIFNKIEEISKCLGAAVEFNLPMNGRVNLVLADKNGRKHFTLIDNEFLRKGVYSKEFDISTLPKGDYLYKFKSNNIEQTRELKLVK